MDRDDVDKPTPTSEPLRVGLIADAEGARQMAPAVDQPVLAVVAQSGDPASQGLVGGKWYDDARVMLAQSDIEALLLATSTRVAVELAGMAAEHDLAVWRLPPLARNFDRATEEVTRMRQRKTLCRVASWWEMVAGDVRSALERHKPFRPAFTYVRISAAGPSVRSWRATLGDAPGGVLATDAYGLLEALIGLRKMPDQVSASVANVRRCPGEAPRETEDVANAILRYEGGGTAVVQATWDIPPFGWTVEHHGADASVTLDPERVVVRAADGEVLAEWPLPTDEFVRLELERFAAAVRRSEEDRRQDATWERHLAVTALLQAVYLSARTGQPESPLKLYEVQGWPEPRW